MASSEGLRSFEGTWLSRYVIHRSGHFKDEVYEHSILVREQGDHLFATSLPHLSGSTVSLDLAIDPPTATGTWREATASDGPYEGAIYHGALQLIIAPDGLSMNGLWIGFGRRLNMNTGEWTLTLQRRSTHTDVR